MTDDAHTADDTIELEGVPLYPDKEVPDGYASLIREVVAEDNEEDRSPSEIAHAAAEQAIASVFAQAREDGQGIREPYKDMLMKVQSEQGRQGLVQVRQTFTQIITSNHTRMVEEQQQDEVDAETATDPDGPAEDGAGQPEPVEQE